LTPTTLLAPAGRSLGLPHTRVSVASVSDSRDLGEPSGFRWTTWLGGTVPGGAIRLAACRQTLPLA